jgi:hypothetical protein
MTASKGLIILAGLCLVLFGTTVLVSISVGGWTLWSQMHAATNESERPNAAPKSSPVKRESAENAPAAPLDAPVIEPATAEPESAKVAADKHAAPKGRDHARQDAMFASVMQRLHSEAYEHFIRQPGFGESRIRPLLTVVKREWKIPDWTSEELAKTPPPLNGIKDLDLIHRFSVKNFGDSNTITQEERWKALAKDPPGKKDQLWEIKALDLVGLVMHESPVVYMSDKLLEMKDLRKSPTREMDLFESEGLEELMSGKALYVRSKHDTIRVLGPIHAGKACLKCHHDAKEGDMLGAFSYTLREGHYVMNGRSSKTGAGIAPLKTPINNPK